MWNVSNICHGNTKERKNNLSFFLPWKQSGDVPSGETLFACILSFWHNHLHYKASLAALHSQVKVMLPHVGFHPSLLIVILCTIQMLVIPSLLTNFTGSNVLQWQAQFEVEILFHISQYIHILLFKLFLLDAKFKFITPLVEKSKAAHLAWHCRQKSFKWPSWNG